MWLDKIIAEQAENRAIIYGHVHLIGGWYRDAPNLYVCSNFHEYEATAEQRLCIACGESLQRTGE